MTKTKQWKWTLIVLCVTLVLSLATICLSEVIRPRVQADDLVLDGNTAQYTFENDVAHPWIYERATNTWYNNSDSSYGLSKVFTVKITQPGDVVFAYKTTLYNSNSQGKTQYAHNQNDFYAVLTRGGVANTIITRHGETMSDFVTVKVTGLSVGDTIVFTHHLGSSSTSDTDRAYIKGLTAPEATQVTVKTSVDGEGGSIRCEADTQTSWEKKQADGTPITFTAEADASYVFAYWTKGDEIVSYDAQLNLVPLVDEEYKARFVSETTAQFSADGWEQSQAGGTAYKLSTESDAKKLSKLTYEFVGEKYLYFEIAHNLVKVGYDCNDFHTTLNDDKNAVVGGKLPEFSSNKNVSSFNPEDPTFDKGYIHVTGEGYHRLSFVYDSSYVDTEDDYLEIRNFEVRDTPKETTEIVLEYNEKYGTVYIDGKATAPGTVTVPKNVNVYFSAVTVASVTSEIDPQQQVPVRWNGFYTNAEPITSDGSSDYSDKLIWPDLHNCNLTFDGEGAVGNNGFKMTGNVVKAKMQEYAASPAVSYIIQQDGDMGEETPARFGEDVTLQFGHEYNISVLVKDYPGLDAKYTIKIDGVAREDINFVDEANRKYFYLPNITANTQVTVAYQAEGYYDSEEFTINFVIAESGSVETGVLAPDAQDISVANDEFVPWVFSAAYSSEQGNAYMAGNSGALGYYGKATSSLKFTVQGEGILSFDFKLYYGSYWLLFTEGQPYSITQSILSGYSENLIDDNAETVWKPYEGIIARGATSPKTKDPYKDQYMYWFVGTKYDGGKTTELLDDGWANVRIPVGHADQATDIYVTYYRNSDGYTYSTPFKDIAQTDYALIRNAAFYKGQGKVNYSTDNTDGGTVKATYSGEELETGNDVPLGSRVTFTATANDGYQFYGWVNGTGELVSQNSEFTTSIIGEVNYKAVFGRSGQYILRNGGKYYDDFETALSEALEGDKLLALKGFTIGSSVTIPKGVSVIFPVDELGNYNVVGTAATATTRVSWSSTALEQKYKKFTLTIDTDATLTIKGSLCLGAILHYPDQSAQGHTSGDYHQIDLNGNIVVEQNGTLDVCGRVVGKGGITVNKGGKLIQPFMILDYSGGTNTQAMFNDGVTPFKMYSMVNIQCEGGFTVNYGGTLYGHASLFFWGGVTTIDQPFVTYDGAEGDEETALIILKDKASAKFVYDDKHARPTMEGTHNPQDVGKTTITVSGGATAGYMSFPLGINTSAVYFSLPYNFEMNLESGEYVIAYPYKLMPGAVLNVKNGASLTVKSGAGLHVYDSFAGPNVTRRAYPSAEQLDTAQYNTYASLVVDGKLVIENNAEFLGTVQTTGNTGRIEIAAGAKVSERALFDGAVTQYSCNYTSYMLAAHVYDAAHDAIVQLEAGRTYVGKEYKGEENKGFTIPGIKFEYETETAGTDNGHGKSHTLGETTTAAASGLVGSWVVEHGSSHVYDWTPQDGDGKPTADNKHVTLTRQCTELGCDHEEKRELLYIPESLGDIVYGGKEVTEEQLKALFEGIYGEGITAAFSGYESARDAQDGYTVTVTLTNAYWLDGESYSESKELSFDITKKSITVTAQAQNSVYGDDNTINQQAFDAPGLCEGDSLSLKIAVKGGTEIHDAGDYTLEITLTSGGSNDNYTIELEEGTYTVKARDITVKLSSKEREYNGEVPQASEIQATLNNCTLGYEDQLTGLVTVSITGAAKDVATYTVTAIKADNKNYNITIIDGSYEITRKQVTVTADNQTSVFGEQPKTLTYKVVGLVETDDEATFRDTYIKITCEVTESTGEGHYDIVVSLKDAEPLNYKVNFVNGRYDVTNATFKDLVFNNDTVTYDGDVHKLTLTGAPDGAQITYTVGGRSFDGARDVGTYEVTATVHLDNYTDTTRTATLKINELEITVDLPSHSRTYNGNVPQASELQATLHSGSKLGTGDELKDIVTLKIENATKNVGSYAVTGEQNESCTNYKVTFGTNGEYKITEVEITVQINAQSKVYDGQDGTIENIKGVSWQITAGNTVGDEELPITLTLQKESNNKDVGDYDITGSCSDSNYKVTFNGGNGAYKITEKTLTVTANDAHSTYGDNKAQLTYEVEGLVQGDGAHVEVEVTCDIDNTTPVRVGGYTITVTVNNEESLHNYDVVKVNGTYEVEARPVVVTIEDQNAVYNYEEEYTFVSSKWHHDGNVVEGDELTIALTEPSITGAGDYAITGRYDGNSNYTVTFAGSWDEADANQGNAGTYTVAKKELQESDVLYILNVDDDSFNESNPKNYPLKDDAIKLSATANLLIDGKQALSVEVDPAEISASGTHTVTVRIVEDNYTGSKTYKVTVLDGEGYTPNLRQVVDYLDEHYAEMNADELTATDEVFAAVKDIEARLNTLTEGERKAGEDKLAQYEEIVDAWNNTSIDEGVILRAKSLADAVLNGLWTVAAVNALLAAMYVVAKGGLL